MESEEDLDTVATRLFGSDWLIDLDWQGDHWALRAERHQPATKEAVYAMSAKRWRRSPARTRNSTAGILPWSAATRCFAETTR